MEQINKKPNELYLCIIEKGSVFGNALRFFSAFFFHSSRIVFNTNALVSVSLYNKKIGFGMLTAAH